MPAATGNSGEIRPFQGEVLIVGGGMVGLTLAIALAQAGVAVACIDAESPATATDAAFDGRASALSLSSRRLLEGIGVWPLLAPDATPIEDIRVSEKGSLLFLHYDSARLTGEPFGHMVENRHIRLALLKRAAALPSLTLRAPEKVAALTRSSHAVEATLASGERIRAPLAVAADGRDSRLRASARIRTTGWSYDQVGIVCTVAHERDHGNVAHEHFLPAGPFAILPLKGRRCSIVWTERAELAPRIVALDDADFLAELERRFGDFLGRLQVVGPRWAYPLSLQFAETNLAGRLALVGDASQAIHPIAGQGFNLGLRDVASLAEVLVDARRLGLDLGAADLLEKYQQWRRLDAATLMAMTDGLNRLFSNDVAPLKLARDIGLAAVDRMEPLKRFFVKHAMGVSGDLPRLLAGRPL
jgi:2-octaprenyl-6-methoxyphenol hydroxylase